MFRGVVSAMTLKAIPMLNVFPVLTRVVLMPEAMPLLLGGAEFIMEDLFGDANTPIPAPMRTSGRSICAWVTAPSNLVISKKPIEDRPNPVITSDLGPNLSERYPLIGPITDSDTESGTKNMPASRGVSPIIGPCRKKTITSVKEPLESEFRNIVSFPAVKVGFLKSEKSNMG